MVWQHAQAKGGLVVSIPWRFRGPARRDVAAFYLSQLAQGILMGERGVLTGHETLSVQPTDFLVLEAAFAQKSRVDHVSVRVRWSRRRDLTGGTAGCRRARNLPDRPRARGHLDFTSPSSGRNAKARDFFSDADHG
jgi:hypothetical protein